MQVFHAIWLVDEEGRHPAPYTLVSAEDVASGRWRANAAVAEALGIDPDYARRHLAHYTRRLAEGGKYDLTVWPYHAMLGGIGHALVSAVEEAIFFHGVARHSRPEFHVKGDHPLTEHYSVLGPEVTEGPDGEPLADEDPALLATLRSFDAVVVAGQAKSHCVAWTIDDLLAHDEMREQLAQCTYLLEDCTSPIVVPGVVDYTAQADAAFERYMAAGMHVVRSTDPIDDLAGPRRADRQGLRGRSRAGQASRARLARGACAAKRARGGRSRRRPPRGSGGCGRGGRRRRGGGRRPCRGPGARSASLPLRGFSQTTRWARRERRAICSPSSAGSPTSRPSERITQVAPRTTRVRPCSSMRRFSEAPMRVPPSQSVTSSAAAAMAASASATDSARVMRVRRVPKAKASQSPGPARSEAWAKSARARE